MSKKIPLAWASRSRLRLQLPGGLIALHDANGRIEAERYTIDEAAGEIALMADPEGDVTAEVQAEPKRAPAHAADAGKDG